MPPSTSILDSTSSTESAGRMAAAFTVVLSSNIVGDPGSSSLFHQAPQAPRLDVVAAARLSRLPIMGKAVIEWLDTASIPRQLMYESLHLTPSTLSRSKDKPLDSGITERLIRQSDLMVRAAGVFGERAAEWIIKPHPLLGDLSPLEAAANEYGGTKVREILNAIEYGGVV